MADKVKVKDLVRKLQQVDENKEVVLFPVGLVSSGNTLADVIGAEIGVESRVDGVEELNDAVVIYTY